MDILGQIANPRMANIAQAIDIRQQRVKEQQSALAKVEMGRAIAKALPNLQEGSSFRWLAENDPEKFALVAKVLNIPLNDGDRFNQYSNDVTQLYTLAQSDPNQAYAHAQQLIESRKAQGQDTSTLEKWVQGMNEDPMKAVTSLFVMHRSLNPQDSGMSAYEQEKASLAREKFEWQKNNPSAAAAGQTPASIQEIEYYNSLPEGAEKEAVGRKLNMISREGMDLSAYAEKQLDMASTDAAEASSAASRYMTLADQIKASAMSGGLKSTWTEYIKEQTGNQDEVTGLRKQAMQIVNSEAIKNLPPGPATDRDIEMVRAPFPTDKASPEYVANWLSAVARLNEKRAEFSEYKANFISENGSLRTRSGESLISSWRKQQQEQMKSAPTGATQGIANPAATGKSGGVEMTDANGNRAIVYPDGSYEEL
jgi:hypothetical protein